MKKILTTAAIISIALSASSEGTVDTSSPEFGEAVRAYLLENPEVIFEAVEIANARQAEAENEQASASLSTFTPALFEEGNTFVLGNPEAKTTIVEFVDYNCGYCRKAHDAIDAIIAQDSDLKVVIRQFPILSQGSLEASQIAMVIGKEFGPEKAVEFHNAAYKSEVALDKVSALEIAKTLGLDVAKIEAGIEDPAILETIKTTHEAAVALKIEGTPGFIIGEEIVRGYIPEDQLKTMIANTRG